MGCLFVSDLHLCEARPAACRAFLDFLGTRARGASELYVLGDLFDTWLGDDDETALADAAAGSLAVLARQGTRVFLMPGNRDLLLGERFAARAGAVLLTDPCCRTIHGARTLLMHGDTLCSADRAYQRFRRVIRHPLTRALLLALPLAARRRVGQELRRRSRAATAAKPDAVVDAVPAAADAALRHAGATVLIHGHTHRPRRHAHAAGTRYVLGEWDTHGWYLQWQAGDEPRLLSFEIPAAV
jgi:UDP-2,3-diacylglucosamine hydrolase